jgi:hypothetical protein
MRRFDAMGPFVHRAAVCVAVLGLAACPAKESRRTDRTPEHARPEERDADAEPDGQAGRADAASDESRHTVVFADRTSQGYLLLVEGERPAIPDREALQALVRRKLGRTPAADEPELELLLGLIATEPSTAPRTLEERTGSSDTGAPPDLLGLHIDVLAVHSEKGDLISPELFGDPILTRALDPSQRASLAARRWAILLRADYRNQHAVRGLRLLQTLVRLVAADRDALIHDPDTGETVDETTFTQRRLRTTLGNVADQVAVVPFPDPAHPQRVRLITRGMRRFGSVDLELGGLPPDPGVLQRATHLMHGLAYSMVQLGEYDTSGYSVELDAIVTVRHEDVVRAYAGQPTQPQRCDGCPAAIDLHLVERPPEPHDPRDHVVARIVAPRSVSDAPDYDHVAWAEQTITNLMGS